MFRDHSLNSMEYIYIYILLCKCHTRDQRPLQDQSDQKKGLLAPQFGLSVAAGFAKLCWTQRVTNVVVHVFALICSLF